MEPKPKFDVVLASYCYYADLMQTINTCFKDMMIKILNLIKIYNKNLTTKFNLQRDIRFLCLKGTCLTTCGLI